MFKEKTEKMLAAVCSAGASCEAAWTDVKELADDKRLSTESVAHGELQDALAALQDAERSADAALAHASAASEALG